MRPRHVLAGTLVALVGGAAPGASGAQEPADDLYRVTMIRAAPGEWVAMKALIEGQGEAGVTDPSGRTVPYRLRHSQGDHWDFMLIQPIGSISEHFAPERQALEAPFRDSIAEMADFSEDWIVRGPTHPELATLFEGAGLYHLEIFRARAGLADELVDQRVRENGFLADAGLVTNAVFAGVFGADWDAMTIGFHESWVAFGEPSALSQEEQDAVARARCFDGVGGIAPYLRTLLVGHNDTFAVPMN